MLWANSCKHFSQYLRTIRPSQEHCIIWYWILIIVYCRCEFCALCWQLWCRRLWFPADSRWTDSCQDIISFSGSIHGEYIAWWFYPDYWSGHVSQYFCVRFIFHELWQKLKNHMVKYCNISIDFKLSVEFLNSDLLISNHTFL